jgi:hypothetical protein
LTVEWYYPVIHVIVLIELAFKAMVRGLLADKYLVKGTTGVCHLYLEWLLFWYEAAVTAVGGRGCSNCKKRAGVYVGHFVRLIEVIIRIVLDYAQRINPNILKA